MGTAGPSHQSEEPSRAAALAADLVRHPVAAIFATAIFDRQIPTLDKASGGKTLAQMGQHPDVSVGGRAGNRHHRLLRSPRATRVPWWRASLPFLHRYVDPDVDRSLDAAKNVAKSMKPTFNALRNTKRGGSRGPRKRSK
jgi:hypothetical protein